MTKLTLNDIVAGYQSATAYNANNALIEAALENTLSLDGTTPNQMGADFDLNSNSLINVDDVLAAGQITAGTFILNGTVITPTTQLAGALDATSVSFTPAGGTLTTLQDALDDDFLRNDENGTLTGNLNITGTMTTTDAVVVGAGGLTVTAGDLNISAGNVVTSGTVNGVDVTESVQAQAVSDGHVRAGNIQLRNGEGNHFQYFLSGSAENNWFSVGPTSSGADTTWANLDVANGLPTTAKGLIVQLAWSANVDAIDTLADLEVFCTAGDDITTTGTKGVDRNQIFDWRSESETDTGTLVGGQSGILFLPLDDNRWFRLRWEQTNLTAVSMQFRLIGFMTD